jgi:hypothetical protein
VGLKINGTHQLLVYADDVNLLADDIETIKKNTQTLTDAGKEAGLEVNAEKTKYMFLCRHQNAGQNHDKNTGNISFENMAQFRYFERQYKMNGTNKCKYNLISRVRGFSCGFVLCLLQNPLPAVKAIYHPVLGCLRMMNFKISVFSVSFAFI